MKRILAVCGMALMGLSIFAATSCAQQDKSARPSPPAKAECQLAGGKSVTIEYSSPRMKGRKIFGELVPYGKIWRAGANESTTFVTTTELTVGGTAVPAGSYTIFAVPNADKWTLVISKKTGEWGTAYPGEANDLARVEMAVGKTAGPVENFTIEFDGGGAGCTLHMKWETTDASVKVAAK
ncbi:MAG: DUF2911 domain-containing protein [Candidatus Acidiferrales bacterium]